MPCEIEGIGMIEGIGKIGGKRDRTRTRIQISRNKRGNRHRVSARIGAFSIAMKIVKANSERFAGLPNFLFEPRFISTQGLQVHFVDEGAGEPILCLHGEPTWSFLYRKMIPIFRTAGY